MDNYKQVVFTIASSKNGTIPLVVNLCDGDEVNGTPGVSVIKELINMISYIPAPMPHYYNITTSKIPIEKGF